MIIYQDVILDHYKNPRHRSLIDRFDGEAHRVNPTCGDEITVRVGLTGGVIEVGYEAMGCAISVASASAMAELITGSNLAKAKSAYQAFREMLLSRSAGDEELLGDCAAFSNLADYPARINCAILGWKALDQALGVAP